MARANVFWPTAVADDTELTLSASPTEAVGQKALFHGTARVGIAEPTFVYNLTKP